MSCEAPANGASSNEPEASYYGRPIIKAPIWTDEIGWYLFVGGLAGASAPLGLAARFAGNHVLARSALLAALGGSMLSPALLIKDLGRPNRFLNMLRVVKITSPMNVGSWILVFFGTASSLAALSDLFGVFKKVGKAAEASGAGLGLVLATYTAVLLADTAVPVWHEARRELPFVFAGGAAASAGACACVLTPTGRAGAARRLIFWGVTLELTSSLLMKRRLGALLAEPYEQGAAGAYDKAAAALSATGAGLTLALGGRRRWVAAAGGLLVLCGALCQRFAIFRAGVTSADDPKFTVGPQRAGSATCRPCGQYASGGEPKRLRT